MRSAGAAGTSGAAGKGPASSPPRAATAAHLPIRPPPSPAAPLGSPHDRRGPTRERAPPAPAQPTAASGAFARAVQAAALNSDVPREHSTVACQPATCHGVV